MSVNGKQFFNGIYFVHMAESMNANRGNIAQRWTTMWAEFASALD